MRMTTSAARPRQEKFKCSCQVIYFSNYFSPLSSWPMFCRSCRPAARSARTAWTALQPGALPPIDSVRTFKMSSAEKKRFEMGEDVAALRKNYESTPFTEDQLVADRDPIAQFDNWFKLAKETGTTYEEVNAMTLATSTAEGRPSARMVLLKGYDGDGFRFFSNYESRKGGELAGNPFAALVFYWPALNRSVRVEGRVERLPGGVSDDYFHSRPHGSQIGSSCSRQSTVLASRDDVVRANDELAARFPEGSEVPRPEYWGGYLVRPDAIEFWQGQTSRLHDRIKFRRDGDSSGKWVIERLSP